MSSLLYSLGKLCYRRWGLVMAVWLVVLVCVGGAAASLGRGTSDVFRIPGAESFQAFDRLGQVFPEVSGANGQMLVVANDGGDVTSPEIRSEIRTMVRDLKDVSQVAEVLGPFNDLVDETVNQERDAAVIQVQMVVGPDEITPETKDELIDLAERSSSDAVTFHPGGGAFAPVPPEIGLTEGIGLLVALLVLTMTFGSLLAAGLPLTSALVGIGVTMAAIWTSTQWLTVTSTAPFLALMIGLAVGIDYGLFVLARHRDQLADGVSPEESTGRAVATAGSAVVFAGLTVMIALAGLSVTGISFLTLMGLASAVAVLVAVLIALTLVPAVFGLLKGKLTPRRKRMRKSDKKKATAEPRKTMSQRWVRMVTRFPVVTVVVVGTGLVALAIPALGLRLALPDNGTAKEGLPQRTTYDLVSEKFGVGYNGPLVVTADIVQSTDPLGLVADVKQDLLMVPGVQSVPLATPNRTADTMMIQVVPETGPNDVRTEDLIKRLRDLRPEMKQKYDIDIAVTGLTAAAVDVSERLRAALVPFALLVMGLSLLLLAMVFRSIAVPIKATLGYLLSVAASFGLVVLVYQDGFLEHQLHTVAVGPIVCFLPILLMGLLFGLAMDYEVFLVSRMREEYVHGIDAHQAIRRGFTSSAKVVTAAALIMISVFAAFVPHGDASTQPIAFALAVGVFIDAFLVRMTLVPAVMALLGDRAWWLPKWLDRRLPAFDVEGEGVSRQLHLTEWPAPDAHLGIHAELVSLVDGDDNVLNPVSFDVAPGEVLLVRGEDHRARAALGLAIAGRTKTTGGILKVAGYLAPEQAMMLRPSVSLVRLTVEDDPSVAVREAIGPRTRVLVVDGLDSLATTYSRDQVLAEVVEHARVADVAAVVMVSQEALDSLGPIDPSTRILNLFNARITRLGEPVTEGVRA